MSKVACYTLCALLCVNSYPVEAQDSKNIPRLGFLSANAAQNESDRLAVFREGLRELGYIEAKNILIETDLQTGSSIVSRSLRPDWSGLMSTSSSLPVTKQCRPQKTQLRPSRLLWDLAVIQLAQASSRAWRGLAETLQG